MRIRTSPKPVFVVLSLAALTALAGCRRKPVESEPIEPESTVTEENENGTISWDVGTDGHVRAILKGTDGQQVTTNVTGTLTWPGDATDQDAEAVMDDKGYLVANGPPLDDDLTEIDYDLDVGGKQWTGSLHVPRGGTRAIDEDAKVVAGLQGPEAGKLGPNGGTIQMLGGERVEMVADRDTQEMRIYVLGPDYQVIEPGERRFRVGYVADYPDTLTFVREPGAVYYVAPWRARIDPFRMTVSMTFGARTSVGIVGWSFGQRLVVGVRAPVVRIAAERHWTASTSVRVGVGVGVGVVVGVGVRERVSVGGGVRVNERVEARGRVEERGHAEGREREGREHEAREREGREREGREREGREREARERDKGREHDKGHEHEHAKEAGHASGAHQAGHASGASHARPSSGGRSGGGRHR
jgi:hypothetical protein